MALALVVVAQQLITVDLSPVSNQRLWMKTFVSLSFYWLFFVIVQSVIIGFLYYIREDHQAKKEGKRLSMMLPGGEERQALMGRSQEQEEDSNEEENALQETTKSSPDGVEMAGEDDLPNKTEPTKKDHFLYTFSLRRFDMWCLFFAFSTYTGFIVYMFVSVSTGQWEQLVADDPRWFDEADISYPNYYYNATDPNS